MCRNLQDRVFLIKKESFINKQELQLPELLELQTFYTKTSGSRQNLLIFFFADHLADEFLKIERLDAYDVLHADEDVSLHEVS